uniref:Isoform 3 of Putative protein MSS51 homolog, mitochondrial n=1 Tax=Homo sapiens TaxID=9606 RepID=Q4VC12-3|nr:hypothetical protein [Homo sapiens]
MGVPPYQALDFDVLKKCSRGWKTHFDSVLTVEHSLVGFQTPRFSGTVRGAEMSITVVQSARSQTGPHTGGFVKSFVLWLWTVSWNGFWSQVEWWC